MIRRGIAVYMVEFVYKNHIK